MALKYTVALGDEVSVFARSRNKEQNALKLGAKALFSSVTEAKESFGFIISAIFTPYNINAYINLLKFGGEMTIVGLLPVVAKVNIDITALVLSMEKNLWLTHWRYPRNSRNA